MIEVKRNGYISYKKFEVYALGTSFIAEHWLVTDIETNEEYRLTDKSDRFLEDKKDSGKFVQFKVIRNYGYDPYDNNIPGIDYYDAAEIIKYHNKKDIRNIKLRHIIRSK